MTNGDEWSIVIALAGWSGRTKRNERMNYFGDDFNACKEAETSCIQTTTHTLDFAGQPCWVTVPHDADFESVTVQAHDLAYDEAEQVKMVGYLLTAVTRRWSFSPVEWGMVDDLNPEARGLLDEELDMIGCRLPVRPVRKTDDVREALITASGSEVNLDGRRFRLTAGFRHVCYPTQDAVFCADAEIVDPATDEDREYPIVPLWEGESELSEKLVGAFAVIGGFSTEGGVA